MNDKQARRYLPSKPEAAEDFPFGPDVYVYKIRGKMSATEIRHGRETIYR